VFPDLSGVVVVHDRYQNYDAFPGIIHQLCAAHLLRDLADAAETYPAAIWPGQIAGALRRLIHAANQARDKNLAAVAHDIAVPLIHAFRHGVLAGLSEIPRRPGRKQHPCRDLLECLRDRRGDVLRFVSDLRIPPTSNDAERDLRPAKTQQKISGRLRSEQATRHRYAIRGYLSTAAKHGINVLAALRDALESHPWMPPIPTPITIPPITSRRRAPPALKGMNAYGDWAGRLDSWARAGLGRPRLTAPGCASAGSGRSSRSVRTPWIQDTD
jgi:hypothetical protein